MSYRLASAPLILLLTSAANPTTSLQVDVSHLRNSRGVVHACLSASPAHFPDCKADPAALRLTVPATSRALRFAGYRPGRYAVTLFHDENGNQRLDTVLGIPREGFGFSRNPVIRFGAPRFKQVDIELGPGLARHSVRMQYLL